MSKHMYCVFEGRAVGRILSPLVVVTTASLVSACGADLGRFNQPASFALSDDSPTASLPVPAEPLYGNRRRSSAPPPDYTNRPSRYNSPPRTYQGQYGNQRPYGSPQGHGQNSQNAYGNQQRYGTSQNSGGYGIAGRDSYNQQSSVTVARLPERNRVRGPLPPKNSAPQVTYKAPEKTAAIGRGNERIVEVSQGQTLYGIAKANGVSVQDIKSANNIKGNSLEFGQKLIIPGQGSHSQTAYAAPSKRPASSNARRIRTEPVQRNRGTGATYRVTRGDSLYSIARRHGMTSTELARYNGISRSGTLKPGQTLSVPKGAKVKAPASRKPVQIARRSDIRPTATRRLPRPEKRSISNFRWPVDGRIISRFGAKNNGTHNDGVNLAVPVGTSVRSAENGVVAYAGNELKGYGNLILVRHADNWVSAYAHVEKILVKRGDNISRGQVIAKSGKSGNVDRPQVHFELRKNSKPVNPLTHLASR